MAAKSLVAKDMYVGNEVIVFLYIGEMINPVLRYEKNSDYLGGDDTYRLLVNWGKK